jgi:hypothetical protein
MPIKKSMVYPTQRLQTPTWQHIDLVPEIRGARRVLVTEARRRESLVGRVKKVTDSVAGGWLLTDDGDHVRGRAVNEHVRSGAFVMGFPAEHEWIIGTVRWDNGSSLDMADSITNTGQRIAYSHVTRWVKATNAPLDLMPQPWDDDELVALKMQVQTNHERWTRAVAAISRETEGRGMNRSLETLASEVGFSVPTPKYARVIQVDVMIPVAGLEEQTSTQIWEAAKAASTQATRLGPRYPAQIARTEFVADGTNVARRPEAPGQAELQAMVQTRFGYNVYPVGSPRVTRQVVEVEAPW